MEVALPVWKLLYLSGSYPASLEVALQHNSGLSVRELLLRVKYLQSIVMCLMLSLEHGDLLKVVSKVSRAWAVATRLCGAWARLKTMQGIVML